MKYIVKIFLILNLLVMSIFAQHTADLFIENAQANGTTFTWEIHITPTNDWGTANGATSLGDCSWYFSYNTSVLSNPQIIFQGSAVDQAHYVNTTGITGGRVYVDTKLNSFDPGVPMTQGVKYHVYTVQMDISDPNAQSLLEWDHINTGIFNALDESVNENYIGTGDIPLPVELTTLNVEQQNNESVGIHWETATELNNYGFEIQRSVLNENEFKPVNSEEETAIERDWQVVGFVKGSGNSNAPKKYSYVDKNLFGGSHFVYRLKQIDVDGSFEYSDEVEIEVVPTKYELSQNYPNPFNPSTTIKFSLPENTKVRLDVYNLIGELVKTLVNKELEAGFQKVNFDASGLTSGVYFYRLSTSKFNKVRKMLLLK